MDTIIEANQDKTQVNGINRIAVIGNYIPKRCGIATFTTDLCRAMAGEYPDKSIIALPITDIEEGYKYPGEVRFEMNEKELDSYRRGADFLNINNVDMVLLQHEFGIFGGPAGSHILELLKDLSMPLVTTLHTVLPEPEKYQKRVLDDLMELSQRVVVMSEKGKNFLEEIFRVPEEKIDIIPHGIHDVTFEDPNFHKDRFGVEGKNVILTFGLLAPDKGIENMIQALPKIVEKHPDTVYVILGVTHPQVKKRHGEKYRFYLEQLASQHHVEDNVSFFNRFVSNRELMQFIGAADIYVTPYNKKEQITSGTLAYTVGAGKAVVSTPYWHAEELLDEERGVLIPFKNPDAMADAIIDLLDNETQRHAIRKKAYLYGRDMTWNKVARSYMESFQKAKANAKNKPSYKVKTLANRPRELPTIMLDHMELLTDDTGILQHAKYSFPNFREGYTTDDNARALIAVTLYRELTNGTARNIERITSRYMAFLQFAFNPETNRFRNFLSFDRKWLEDTGSDDSHARALWGLGTVLGRSEDKYMKKMAADLFEKALPPAKDFEHPRSIAFALLAVHEYLRKFYGDRQADSIREILAEKILKMYKEKSSPDWVCCSDSLTYCNAKLPHALILCGQWMGRDDIKKLGLDSLEWQLKTQKSPEGYFSPVGCNGFYPRGKEKAQFDQQPIEAYSMVSACIEAYHATGDKKWMDEAYNTFYWFMGRNDLNLPLYDTKTNGCKDGLECDRTNENQGAESTLAFILSLLELNLSQHIIPNRIREKVEA